MTSEKICFSARDGVRLEGLVDSPDAVQPAPATARQTLTPAGQQKPATARLAPAVVITHSHPLQTGGHMYAHVLRAVAASLVQRGFVVLRFNFRGVQGSAGAFDDGRGELLDVGGAVDYLRACPQIAPDNIALFGYSFGSRVCLPYASADPRIQAVVGLGMPPRRFLHDPPPVQAPLLLVAGSEDRVIPPAQLEQFLALYPNASAHILPGAGHSYRGHEAAVGAAVADFLAGLML